MLVRAKLLLSSYVKNKNNDTLLDGINIIDNCVKETRNLSHVVFLPKEVDENFVSSLKILLNQLNVSEGIKFNIITDIYFSIKSKDFKINLYRILQEQIRNIIKYSKAINAVIAIVNIENKLIVSVKDDGIGCDINNQPEGIGLTNIRTRVNLYNGKMIVRSELGKGFELKLEFMLNKIIMKNEES